MTNAEELFPVHLCSLLAPAALLLLHVVLPGGFVGSPVLAFSLLSLLTTLAALLAPFLFPPPHDLYRKYVRSSGSSSEKQVPITQRSFAQAFVISVLLYLVVGVFLGANPISQFTATLVWASLMTSLTSVPTVILLGANWDSCIRVLLNRIFVNSAERAMYIMFVSTLLGAWLGAVPIPLDWNRPWQVWPVPCSCGALAGSIVGSGCSLLVQHFSLYPAQLSLSPHTTRKV